jgi:putative flippase GtrA
VSAKFDEGNWPGVWRSVAVRWLKFNAVGGVGIGVQLGALAILKSVCHVHYLVATAIGVEAAILHNFLWHERFTWADRTGSPAHWRLLKFNLTTGAFSLAGNLLLMRILVGSGHMQYLVANGMVISICSVGNFLVSDQFVFRRA